MSGDQAKTPLLISEIAVEKIEKIKVSKTSAKPTTITVLANGLEIQSSLNPNAFEFFPSYLQKQQQSNFNEEPLFEGNRNNEEISNKKANIAQKLVVEETGKEGESFVRTTEVKSNLKVGNSIAKKEKSENVIIDNKLEIDTEKNQLCVLFASPCDIKHSSSSKTLTSISSNSGVENSLSYSEKDNEEEDQCQSDNIAEVAYKLNLKDRKIENEIEENDAKKRENILDDFSENHNTNIIKENVQDHDTNVTEENAFKIETDIVYLFSNHKKTEIKSVNKSNAANIERNPTADRKEPGHTKKLNVYSKITKAMTGTVKKPNLSKTAQDVDHKKDIKHKAETSLVKSSNTTKSNMATKTTIYSSIKSNKPTVQSLQKEATKNFSKGALSNRSTSCTEKSSSNAKLNTKYHKVRFAENPEHQKQKAKESNPKSPRPTVSSKLRKTETQKRRNLFFDIDTVKMSEFLFK